MFGWFKKKRSASAADDIKDVFWRTAAELRSLKWDPNDIHCQMSLQSSVGSLVAAIRQVYPNFPYEEDGTFGRIITGYLGEPEYDEEDRLYLLDQLHKTRHDPDATLSVMMFMMAPRHTEQKMQALLGKGS